MTICPVLLLLTISFTTTVALSLTLETPLRLIDAVDECFNESRIPVETTLCSSASDILGDVRFEVSSNSYQCRSLCQGQTPPFLSPSHRDVDCDLCQDDAFIARYALLGNNNFYHFCAPRHECIEKCGPENPGCVYTGSCASQICFSGADSGKTAQIRRYTHRGPGTIIVVDNTDGPGNGTLSSTSSDNPGDLPTVLGGGADVCTDSSQTNVFFNTSTNCSLSPLGDGREDSFGQCRVACTSFDYAPHEVLRFYTSRGGCNFCSTPEADRWYTPASGDSPNLCIPRETCIEKCGPEGYGCVYTGSCKSRICFSGIDSKEAAVFTALSDDGKESSLAVDNSGGPKDADPPAFGPLGSEGNATSVPRESTPSAPSPSPGSSDSGTQGGNSEPGASEGGGRTIWVWLGPVIAAGSLGVVIAVTLLVVIARRNRARGTEFAAPPMNTLPFQGSPMVTDTAYTAEHCEPPLTVNSLTTPPPTPPGQRNF